MGYVPYTTDLSHPADRRRLASWATEKGVVLNVLDPLDSDVLVLSNAANFGYWLAKAKQPIYLDLVDGYLAEKPPFIKDFLRNALRSFQGLSSLRWITYSRHLRYALKNSHGVIVPSKEQADLLSNLNRNIFIIPDDHFELAKSKSDLPSGSRKQIEEKYLFWEGYGYTIKHFEVISAQLDEFLLNNDFRMYLVTVESFKKWGGKIGRIQTRKYIDRIFPISKGRIEIVSWSLENVKKCAELSSMGIIPIDSSDNFAFYKSENKLLSMWNLGLPVLYSRIPSYERVATLAGQLEACLDPEQWKDALDVVASSSDVRARFKRTGLEYVNLYSNHESLMSKWDQAINQTNKS